MTDSLVSAATSEFMTTREVALELGLAVRSVQLMVDRGEFEAWRTTGGHRRITRESFERWRGQRQPGAFVAATPTPAGTTEARPAAPQAQGRRRLLLIEDSVHFQNLVRLLCEQSFPELELHVAGDGIVGLALAGLLEPEVLLIDILLPGLDGGTLINTLRSHPQFARSNVVVITSLNEAQLEPYRLAIGAVPVVHKPRLVADLPPVLSRLLLQVDKVSKAAASSS